MTTLPTNSNQYLAGEKNEKIELSLFDTITLRGISLRNVYCSRLNVPILLRRWVRKRLASEFIWENLLAVVRL